MKVPSLPLPRALAALALLAASAPAAEVAWTATGSSAWIVNGNWSSGAMPGSGDVATFSNLAPSWTESITYSMTNALNPTPNEGHVGAVHVLSTRTTKGLTIESNSSSTNTFLYYGATVNGVDRTILANDSGRNLSLIQTGQGAARLWLAAATDSIVQVNGAGSISVGLSIIGTNSRLILQGNGSGTLTLSGTNSSYSGGTRIDSGTLNITHAKAAGTGAIINEGGTLRVAAGVSLPNRVILATEAASFEKAYGVSEAFGGYRAESGSGGVTAALSGGTSSAARTLAGSFEEEIAAGNDALRVGEAFTLQGTGGDPFVLTLSVPIALDTNSYLAWYDGSDWINATLNETGPLAVEGWDGSYDSAGISATADYLGSWGYDTATGSVWAVLGHDGTFAVVPEPSQFVLLAPLVGLAFLRAMRRRQTPLRSL